MSELKPGARYGRRSTWTLRRSTDKPSLVGEARQMSVAGGFNIVRSMFMDRHRVYRRMIPEHRKTGHHELSLGPSEAHPQRPLSTLSLTSGRHRNANGTGSSSEKKFEGLFYHEPGVNLARAVCGIAMIRRPQCHGLCKKHRTA